MRGPLLALAAFATLAGGCTCGPAPEIAPAPPRELVILLPKDHANLAPILASGSPDADFSVMVYPSLFGTDYRCPEGMIWRPGLADRWTRAPDGRSIEVHLDPAAAWPDGRPVTAEDLRATWALVADPAVASPRQKAMERLAGLDVLDERTVRFRFTQAYAEDLQLAEIAFGPLPAHLLSVPGAPGPADLARSELNRHPPGYGPWRLVEWVDDARVVFEPNPAFRGPAHLAPSLDRVTFKAIDAYASRLAAMTAGQADVMAQVQPDDVPTLTADPAIRIVRRGMRAVEYVGFNLRRAPFDDPRVRRALAAAIDVPGMVDALLTGPDGTVYGRPATGPLSPVLCDLDAAAPPPVARDPDVARRLLAEAGFVDTDGDGLVDRGGQPLRFELTVQDGAPRRRKAAERMQLAWRAVGVDAQLREMASQPLTAAARNGELQAFIHAWLSGLSPDPRSLWQAPRPDRPRTMNLTGYDDPETERLLDAALATPDPSLAVPEWAAFQARLAEQQPVIWLWWVDDLVAVRDGFAETYVDPVSPFHDLHRWKRR